MPDTHLFRRSANPFAGYPPHDPRHPFRAVAYWQTAQSLALEGVKMKKWFMILALAVTGVFLGALPALAGVPQGTTSAAGSSRFSKLNPVHLIKRLSSKSATDQLDANSDENKKLTTQLRSHGVLPKGTDLKDACSLFKDLAGCVSALHASHNLKLNFNCVKREMTGVETRASSAACKGPVGDKGMSLAKAIGQLKPSANAKVEAKHAQQQAHDDLKDATS